jgi:broad specificity phosphatase PhoE
MSDDDVILYFTRHGESVANASDRAGVKRPKDADRLSDRGWEQARGVGRRLEGHGLELVLCSDMRRARETAEGIAEVLGLPVELDADLREVQQSDAFHAASPDFGDTSNLVWMPGSATDFAEPGAESFDDIVARVHAVQDRLSERAAQQHFVAVSHFGFLHYFLGASLFGEDFAPEHVPQLYRAGHANTGISIFERRRRELDGLVFDGWSLTTWNDQAHL